MDDENKFVDYYLVLFIIGSLFLLVPLFSNILQLHFEIGKWSSDPVLRKTPVPGWIRSRVKLLYLISIVCGSSFSAVQLCNSYLFKLSVFSMGLSRYHKNLFQTKRFSSIVLLEVKLNFIITCSCDNCVVITCNVLFCEFFRIYHNFWCKFQH